MAVVNANYQFTLVDIGNVGRQSDGGVFSASNLGFAMNSGKLPIPGPPKVSEFHKDLPYVFIGDEAFPLKPFLIRTYSRIARALLKRIFNYRLSRARRIVENVFGILDTRFKIFRQTIIANLDTATKITNVVVALHNFLMFDRDFSGSDYCLGNYVDFEVNKSVVEGEWRKEHQGTGLVPVQNMGSHNYSFDAKQVLDDFRNFFNSAAGSVQWQYNMVNSTANPLDM